MASNTVNLPTAALAVKVGDKWVPTCDRHAKAALNLNNMLGKYTDFQYNETKDHCADCEVEELKRQEEEAKRKAEGKPPRRRRGLDA